MTQINELKMRISSVSNRDEIQELSKLIYLKDLPVTVLVLIQTQLEAIEGLESHALGLADLVCEQMDLIKQMKHKLDQQASIILNSFKDN